MLKQHLRHNKKPLKMPCFNAYLTYYVLKHSQQFNYTLSLALAKTQFLIIVTLSITSYLVLNLVACVAIFSDSVVVSVESYLTASITL